MRRAAALAGVVVATALAGVVVDGVVDGGRAPVVAAAAAVLGALVATLASATGRRGVPTVAVVVGVAGTVATLGALPVPAGVADPGPLATLAEGLTRGWGRLLTTAPPVDPDPRLLAPVVATCFLAAAAGAGRVVAGRSAATPLLGPALALVAATLLAGADQPAPLRTGLAFVVAAAVVLVAARPRPAATGRGPVAATAPAARRPAPSQVVVPLAAAVAGALLLPGLVAPGSAAPYDPRSALSPSSVPTAAVNPVELVAGQLGRPDDLLYTVTADEPVTLRLAVLDTFDGVRWTSTAGFRPSGQVVPTDEALGAAAGGPTVEVAVEVADVDGPWLPVVGLPRRVEGVTVLVDPASGSLLADSGRAAGAGYRIEATSPPTDLDALASAGVAAGDEAAAHLALPDGLPGPLLEAARLASAGAASALDQALILSGFLEGAVRSADRPVGGHSYGHLARMLTTDEEGGVEQVAAAFAVLGRVVGLPTRLAVGFGPGQEVAPGRHEVRSGDVEVWPEVAFEGAGWVRIDVGPGGDGAGGGAGDDDGGVGDTDALPPVTTDAMASSPPTPPAPDAAPGPDADPSSSSSRLLVAGAVLAVPVVTAAAVVAIKRRRTGLRRGSGDARARVLGAWEDVLDRLVEAGLPAPHLRTVGDVAGAAEAAYGGSGHALAGLYRPVNRALYGPAAPPAEADAEQAWRARDRLVDSIARHHRRRTRMAMAIDPRTLRRRRLRSPS